MDYDDIVKASALHMSCYTICYIKITTRPMTLQKGTEAYLVTINKSGTTQKAGGLLRESHHENRYFSVLDRIGSYEFIEKQLRYFMICLNRPPIYHSKSLLALPWKISLGREELPRVESLFLLDISTIWILKLSDVLIFRSKTRK